MVKAMTQKMAIEIRPIRRDGLHAITEIDEIIRGLPRQQIFVKLNVTAGLITLTLNPCSAR
jgi:hypothetical protein